MTSVVLAALLLGACALIAFQAVRLRRIEAAAHASAERSSRDKALRSSQEREEQATLMGAISDAILAVDRDELPLFYNARFAMLVDPKELKSGKRLWEFFRDPGILEAYGAALRDGRPGSVNAIPIEEGITRRFYSISVSPLRDSQAHIYGAVGVFHDVTDLKLAEQIRIDFVANVSHELRTPLTSIKGYADTVIQDARQGRTVAPEHIEVIARNADRLMNLINDLLDLSSIESSGVLQKAVLSTQDVTQRVIGQLSRVFEAKNQKVSVNTTASKVFADPRRLEQVLTNLLDNASKYTPSGGAISVEWTPSAHGDVVLVVADTGPGIAAEHHARLFERFYRVDKARSREMGGTGLGLAIVKHIMQRHEGSVWVESKLGEGSRFHCRFPAG